MVIGKPHNWKVYRKDNKTIVEKDNVIIKEFTEFQEAILMKWLENTLGYRAINNFKKYGEIEWIDM